MSKSDRRVAPSYSKRAKDKDLETVHVTFIIVMSKANETPFDHCECNSIVKMYIRKWEMLLETLRSFFYIFTE